MRHRAGPLTRDFCERMLKRAQKGSDFTVLTVGQQRELAQAWLALDDLRAALSDPSTDDPQPALAALSRALAPL